MTVLSMTQQGSHNSASGVAHVVGPSGDSHWAIEGTRGEAPAIELKDVSVRYRSYLERHTSFKETALKALQGKPGETFEYFDALSNVSLWIPKGSVLGIVGSNGSGKSTLLKVLAGVLKPSSGTVKVAGAVASLIELGVAFDPELNAIENLYLHGALHKKSRREIQGRIDHILDFAELTEVATKPIKYYSSGMIARLGFSAAVDVDPDILLVDEILGVGDERFQRKCSKVFDRFFAARKTVILVTHSMEMLGSIATHAALLSKGRLVYVGDPDGAIARYREDSYETALPTERPVVSLDRGTTKGACKADRFKMLGRPLSDYKINIVTEPAPGWVLRRISEAYAEELEGAAVVSTEPDPAADVNFYVNYALFQGRTRCDVGFFTHREPNPPWSEVFDKAAREVTFCVSMCKRTAALLPPDRTDVVLVAPDRQFMRGKLTLGVVAREYESGRKRFEWIDELRQIPGVEVQFSGGRFKWHDMPAFYDSIDYLLVLGGNEGGPVPLVEALAMGVPAIAPDVGFVPEYSTLRYHDLEDLKEIIRGLVIAPDAQFESTKRLVACFERALQISSAHADSRASEQRLA